MAKRKDATYFQAVYEKERWFYFKSIIPWYIIRFAGSRDDKANFFLESLVDMFWEQEWKDIYSKALAWLANIAEKNKALFNKPCASLVMYKKEYADDNFTNNTTSDDHKFRE